MTFFYINATLVFARIFFPSSKTFFLYTQKTHFSQILSTNLSKSLCPLKPALTLDCSQGETPTSIQMSFPQTVSHSLSTNSLVLQTKCCSSCLGGCSQMITEVNMVDAEVLGWRCCTQPVGCTAKFSETPL